MHTLVHTVSFLKGLQRARKGLLEFFQTGSFTRENPRKERKGVEGEILGFPTPRKRATKLRYGPYLPKRSDRTVTLPEPIAAARQKAKVQIASSENAIG